MQQRQNIEEYKLKEERLKLLKKNLAKLELEVATYGPYINAPLKLKNDIDAISEEINSLSEDTSKKESVSSKNDNSELETNNKETSNDHDLLWEIVFALGTIGGIFVLIIVIFSFVPSEADRAGKPVQKGDTWSQQGIEMTLNGYDFVGENDLFVEWILFNTNYETSYSMVIPGGSISAKDNLGRPVRVKSIQGLPLEVTKLADMPHSYLTSRERKVVSIILDVNKSDEKITEITVVIYNVADLEYAEWKLPLHK